MRFAIAIEKIPASRFVERPCIAREGTAAVTKADVRLAGGTFRVPSFGQTLGVVTASARSDNVHAVESNIDVIAETGDRRVALAMVAFTSLGQHAENADARRRADSTFERAIFPDLNVAETVDANITLAAIAATDPGIAPCRHALAVVDYRTLVISFAALRAILRREHPNVVLEASTMQRRGVFARVVAGARIPGPTEAREHAVAVGRRFEALDGRIRNPTELFGAESSNRRPDVDPETYADARAQRTCVGSDFRRIRRFR